MKSILICLVVTWLAGLPAALFAQNKDVNLGIIPVPTSIQRGQGEFVFTADTPIEAQASDPAARYLIDYLHKERGLANRVEPSATGRKVVLTEIGAGQLPAEGYRIEITPQQVIITGKGAGLFYGVVSLLQMFPIEKTAETKLPAVVIEDHPRFGYRGMHLDVARHFFPPEFVKKYIDLIAFYKLNNFHWHLTDDQGWRIEIKKYPKLTQVGGMRAQTLVGVYWDRMPQYFDGTPYGGFYTQDEIRDIVKYAEARNVTIIPEIEMPGHCAAALASYPELSCDPTKPHKVAETWGIFTDVYCPSDTTFKFLEDVLSEVMDLFPGKYIHIGGDECPKDAWKNSAFCQQLMKDKHLKDEHELQSYFIQRIEEFVRSKGRQIIGWDEILEGGLAPGATVMSWQGEAGGIEAAKQNHDVIMVSGRNGLYFFDKPHYRSELEADQAKYSLEKLYNYDPVPAALSGDQRKYIKGLEAAIWTEYVKTPSRVEFELLPRMLMVSEIGWSAPERKSFADFTTSRLPAHLARFDAQNTNYRVPPAIGISNGVIKTDELKIDLKPSVQGAKIFYTIDGFLPSASEQQYTRPFVLKIPKGEQRELQTIVITQANRSSEVTRTLLYNRDAPDNGPLGAVSTIGGVNYTIFEGAINSLGDLDTAKVAKTGTAPSLDLSGLGNDVPPSVVIFDGYLRLDGDGVHRFEVKTDGQAQLLIDDKPVADHADVPLLRGLHRFRLKFLAAGRSASPEVLMGQNGEAMKPLPVGMLVTGYRVSGITGIDYK